jgi:multiple sugar transport system substrate-binding protein
MQYFPTTRRHFLAQTGKAALAAGIGGAALAACGGNNSSSGPVELTFGWWSNTPTKDTAMKAWIKDFESTNSNIKVKPEILPWQNYWDKLQTSTAGGSGYDIIGMSSGMCGSYFKNGALVDLSTRSDYQDVIKNLSTGALNICKWDEKTYGLPIGTSISILGYNKKLLRDAKVDYPDPAKPMSFEEFKALAKKISKPKTQYALNPLDILDYDTFVRMNGGTTYDRQVNPSKITINTPQGIQGLKDYKSLFTEGIAPPYSEVVDGNGPWAYDFGALETGKIAFARVGTWLFTDMAKNPDYATAPLFKINEPVVLGGVNSLAIYKKSKNADQVWEFLKWAVQTKPEISFAKFSDLPAEKTAFDQIDSYITPKEYLPALKAAYPSFQPSVVTVGSDLGSTLGNIITDFMANKLTAEAAAQQMEQEGNKVLSANT